MAKLFGRAGLRERSRIDERINILINAHIKLEDLFARNEERFAQNEERFAKHEKRFAKNEERFKRTEQAIDRLVAAQARTDQQLRALIDALRGNDPSYQF